MKIIENYLNEEATKEEEIAVHQKSIDELKKERKNCKDADCHKEVGKKTFELIRKIQQLKSKK
tara:strand:- start:2198 stop:2386 length:189 start_codon:yes stop_codon:yes gene_type:complete